MGIKSNLSGEEIVKRYRALDAQRSTLNTMLQEVQEYVAPYRGEMFSDLTSAHSVEYHRPHVFDGTAPDSALALASRLYGDFTNPSVKWFGLRFRQDELNTDADAMQWLEECEERVWRALGDSDFDSVAPEAYLDLTTFGTSIMFLEPQDDLQWRGLDFTSAPVMDAQFEMGPDGQPYRVYRRLRYTWLELMQRFPDAPAEFLQMMGKASQREQASVDTKHEVVFCVYYRDSDDIGNSDPGTQLLPPKSRPVAYCYVSMKGGHVLEEGGYYEFPALVVRWQTVAGSSWGFGPAHPRMSDIRMLNQTVKQLVEARARAIDPPYKTTERGVIGDLNLEPGAVITVTDMDQLEPMPSVSRFEQAEAEILRLQQSIERAFFIDWLELRDRPEMTAYEVSVRQERMLRRMAPVLGRLKTDLLDPLIERVFRLLYRYGQLPALPQSVQGMELDVEYVGPAPRAQMSEEAQGLEVFLSQIAGLAGTPESPFVTMTDLIDTDAAVKLMARTRGVSAKVLRSDEEVEELRKARAEEQAQAKEVAGIQAGGEAMQAAALGGQAVQQLQQGVPAGGQGMPKGLAGMLGGNA